MACLNLNRVILPIPPRQEPPLSPLDASQSRPRLCLFPFGRARPCSESRQCVEHVVGVFSSASLRADRPPPSLSSRLETRPKSRDPLAQPRSPLCPLLSGYTRRPTPPVRGDHVTRTDSTSPLRSDQQAPLPYFGLLQHRPATQSSSRDAAIDSVNHAYGALHGCR
jgi:hypothetical protein